MAGTGAGQSRRSHTKSRKGCKTCKRRHIRCDETVPQCRNCTKHQVRCDYMDAPPSDESVSPVPDLWWSPEIESVLEYWDSVGEASLGDFSIDLRAPGSMYSKSDLHLIYFALYSGQSAETREYTVWTQMTVQTLRLARNYPFLVHSILAFTAQSIAWEKNSASAKNLAYHHGGIALKGLQTAISSFCKENADAVLLASILLSWQANDWRSYASLIAGIRTVIKSMIHWKHESCIPNVIDEQEHSIPQTFPTFSRSPFSDDFPANYSSTLQNIYSSLGHFKQYLDGRPEENKWIEQLMDFVNRLLNVKPAQTPEEQFNHLYAFRKWLFWIPASLLKSDSRDPMTLVVIAHFYAVAQQLEPLFPNVAPAFCSLLSVKPLDEIFDTFEQFRQSSMGQDQRLETLLYLLNYPRQAATDYAHRRVQRERSGFRQSPPALEVLSSDLALSIEGRDFQPQPSPAIMPSPSRSSTFEIASSVSSSQGSPYLEVPVSGSDFSLSSSRRFSQEIPPGNYLLTSMGLPMASPEDFTMSSMEGPSSSSSASRGAPGPSSSTQDPKWRR